MTFQTFKCQLQSVLEAVMANPLLHSHWLNTLSYWENCGARKLSACQHPTKVKEEMLKHAAEEFRHAHYLKQQQKRLGAADLPDYRLSSLLGGIRTYQYLDRLDIAICRILLEKGYEQRDRGALGYLLITYAIERRAEEVYSLYHDALKHTRSPVRVQSILLEEKEHLAEITEELSDWPEAAPLCEKACKSEAYLFNLVMAMFIV